jgi:hypothetical protein
MFNSRDATLVHISRLRHNKNGGAEVHCMAPDHNSVDQSVPKLFFVDHETEQSLEHVAGQLLTAEGSGLEH